MKKVFKFPAIYLSIVLPIIVIYYFLIPFSKIETILHLFVLPLFLSSAAGYFADQKNKNISDPDQNSEK